MNVSTQKPLTQQIFRVECRVRECVFPEKRACLMIGRDTVTACPQCRYQEIPDCNWVCDGCGTEFERLEKHFDIPVTPDHDEMLEAPEISPDVRAVPAVCRMKRFCHKCFKNLE